MGYRIDYGRQTVSNRVIESYFGRVGWMIIGFFAVFTVSVYFFWQEGWTVFRSILFPGNYVAAKEAAEEFVQAVRSGSDFASAVTAFCKDILSNG